MILRPLARMSFRGVLVIYPVLDLVLDRVHPMTHCTLRFFAARMIE
jgi:hypothetical protein